MERRRSYEAPVACRFASQAPGCAGFSWQRIQDAEVLPDDVQVHQISTCSARDWGSWIFGDIPTLGYREHDGSLYNQKALSSFLLSVVELYRVVGNSNSFKGVIWSISCNYRPS